MANKVSYIIQIKDQFSATARKLKKQFTGIDTRIKMANRSLNRFGDKLKKAKKNVNAIATAGLAMSAAVTLPFLLMTKSMVTAASDAVETKNKFNEVFDTVKLKANEVADGFSRSFGVASSTTQALMGATGDLLVGFGATENAALDMAHGVIIASADLASFQNLEGGIVRANEAITKGLVGETESLKLLGIVIRQDTKEFKRNIKMIQRSRRVTLMQAKSIEILRQVVEQSQKSVGDVARTWDDYASVVRRSLEATKEFKESFGIILIPLATKLMLGVTSLANAFSDLSTDMKKIILVIAGLLAVAGPLILVVAGLTFAFTVISGPVLLFGAGIAALTVGISILIIKWDNLVALFSKNKLVTNYAKAIGVLAIAFFVLSGPVFLTALAITAIIVGLSILSAKWHTIVTGLKISWHKFVTLLKDTWGELKNTWNDVISFFKNKWDEIVTVFSSMTVWEAVKLGVKSMVEFSLKWLDKLTAPFKFIFEKVQQLKSPLGSIASFFGFDKELPPGLNKPAFVDARGRPAFDLKRTLGLSVGGTPVTPNGTLSGEIVVLATGETKIKSTKLTTQGSGLDLGLNMAVGL